MALDLQNVRPGPGRRVGRAERQNRMLVLVELPDLLHRHLPSVHWFSEPGVKPCAHGHGESTQMGRICLGTSTKHLLLGLVICVTRPWGHQRQ